VGVGVGVCFVGFFSFLFLRQLKET
jgi:hypothetical protein